MCIGIHRNAIYWFEFVELEVNLYKYKWYQRTTLLEGMCERTREKQKNLTTFSDPKPYWVLIDFRLVINLFCSFTIRVVYSSYFFFALLPHVCWIILWTSMFIDGDSVCMYATFRCCCLSWQLFTWFSFFFIYSVFSIFSIQIHSPSELDSISILDFYKIPVACFFVVIFDLMMAKIEDMMMMMMIIIINITIAIIIYSLSFFSFFLSLFLATSNSITRFSH